MINLKVLNAAVSPELPNRVPVMNVNPTMIRPTGWIKFAVMAVSPIKIGPISAIKITRFLGILLQASITTRNKIMSMMTSQIVGNSSFFVTKDS